MSALRKNVVTVEPPFRSLPRAQQWSVALLAVTLLAAFLLVRLRYPWIFEYEAEESSIGLAHFVEHGVLPRAYHHIRYTNLYVGPLHAYLKAIPYFFTLDPSGDIFFLNLLNVLALGLLFFLLRRFYGVATAGLTLFFFVFSLVSIERCTSAHVRCYSVPLTLIVMVIAARVLLLGESRMIALAVALAFATQVYGLGTLWLPPGLLLLFIVFRPGVARQQWVRASLLLLVLSVVPVVVQELGWERLNLRAILDGSAFRFDPVEIENVRSARAQAFATFLDVSDLALPIPTKLPWLAGLAVCLVGGWRWRKSRSTLDSADLFLSLWFGWFLVLPLVAGVGHRTYLGQFLAPIVMARGIVAGVDWVLQRRERWRLIVRPAAAVLATASLAFALLGPAPTEVVSDPQLPIPTLGEERDLLKAIRSHGLGRPGFDRIVHGSPFQVDSAGDPYLFWTLCHHDLKAPCSAGTGDLSESSQLVALGPDFPYRAIDGEEQRFGRYRLATTQTRLQLPFQLFSFLHADALASGGDYSAIPRDEMERAQLPGDRRAGLWAENRFATNAALSDTGKPIWPLRRTSFAASLLTTYKLEASFAPEARTIPIMRALDVVIRGRLDVKSAPAADKALHLFFTTDSDGGRCQVALFVDGRQIETRESRSEAGSAVLLGVDGTAPELQVPGSHLIAVRLTACSAVNYDLYDLVVSQN